MAESLSRDLQITACKLWSARANYLPTVILLQIIFCSCVVVSNSKKNGSSFSTVAGERFDLSIRNAKTAEIQRRKRKFPLIDLSYI